MERRVLGWGFGVRLFALTLVLAAIGGGSGVAHARGGPRATRAKPFQVRQGESVRILAPRAGDLRVGALPAFVRDRPTRMLSARLERDRRGQSFLVLAAAADAPTGTYALRGTTARGALRTVSVEVVERADSPATEAPVFAGGPGAASLQTVEVIRGRTNVFNVPAGAQGASDVRVVLAACSLAVALASVPDPAPGLSATLGPHTTAGPGGVPAPPLTKLKITVTAGAPLGGGRRLMARRNGTWSLLPLCLKVVPAPTASAPPAESDSTPSEPDEPTVFSRIPVNTTSHRWPTSYLLALASLHVYPGATENWNAFRQRFSAQFEAWGMESSTNTDYVRNSASGTQCAILHDDERIVIAFRGSQSIAVPETAGELSFHEGGLDWSADLNAPYTAPGASWGAQVGVHTGFHLALGTVYPSVRARVQALKQGTQRRVFLTGHSLGGALAMLCAYRFARLDGIDVQGVYTYGQPRVGNAAFVEAYDQVGLHARTFRWAHDGDLATKLPPALSSGYRHAGRTNAIHVNGACDLNAGESLLPGGILPHSMPGYCQRIRACMPDSQRAGLPPAP